MVLVLVLQLAYVIRSDPGLPGSVQGLHGYSGATLVNKPRFGSPTFMNRDFDTLPPLKRTDSQAYITSSLLHQYLFWAVHPPLPTYINQLGHPCPPALPITAARDRTYIHTYTIVCRSQVFIRLEISFGLHSKPPILDNRGAGRSSASPRKRKAIPS
ncbi:hypothetical protein HD806DRAFT_4863 [Xylariaceae sp. AK1471]|nr:hypothetical protein HD806DRAFT_4863 [Xylariaceae sp. AK1471]